MNFITQVTISIVIYFIIRIFNKSEKSLYISASFAGISYILIYLLNFEVITILPTIHFMVTGLSLLFLFIAYNEIIILERKMRKIKNFKAIFTFIAWIIYIITMVGIKFFNFPIKYATRSLFLAMWAVLGAYFMNSYIIGS